MGTTINMDLYLPVINGSDSVILDGSVLKILNANLPSDVYRISDWEITTDTGQRSGTIVLDFKPGFNRGVIIAYFEESNIISQPAQLWKVLTLNGMDVSLFAFIDNPTSTVATTMQFWRMTEASLGDVSQLEIYWEQADGAANGKYGSWAIAQFANVDQNNMIGDVSMFGSDSFINPMTNVNIDVSAGSYVVGAGVVNTNAASAVMTELEEQFETTFGITQAAAVLGDNPYPDASIAINYITWTGNILRNVAGTFEIKKY